MQIQKLYGHMEQEAQMHPRKEPVLHQTMHYDSLTIAHSSVALEHLKEQNQHVTTQMGVKIIVFFLSSLMAVFTYMVKLVKQDPP